MSASQADAEFVLARLFDAPRPLVWDAWTRPAMLARWFGPKGATTTVLSCDLKPGGGLHGRMEMPDGGCIWVRFVYREVTPPSRLAWEHSFADEVGQIIRAPFSDTWPLRLLNTVIFEERGAKTQVTLTSVAIDATAEEQKAFGGMIESMTGGWGGSFDQLDLFLAAG